MRAGPVVRKLRAAWGKLSSTEVLRLRATSAPLRMTALWEFEENTLTGWRLWDCSPGPSSTTVVQIRFFSWPILAAPEAVADPKRLGKRLSNEGRAFSRAINSLYA
jgi:hypothetical protein